MMPEEAHFQELALLEPVLLVVPDEMLVTFDIGMVALPISSSISESPFWTPVMVPVTVKGTLDVVPVELIVCTETL